MRLFRKLALVSILCSALAWLPQPPAAHAGTCCDSCWNQYLSCYYGCNGSPSCEDSCYNAYVGCAMNCRGEHCPI